MSLDLLPLSSEHKSRTTWPDAGVVLLNRKDELFLLKLHWCVNAIDFALLMIIIRVSDNTGLNLHLPWS